MSETPQQAELRTIREEHAASTTGKAAAWWSVLGFFQFLFGKE